MTRRYKLKFTKGTPVDDSFLDFADELFTELGLSPELAQRAADKWQGFVTQRVQAEAAQMERQVDVLKATWGKDWDTHVAAGQKAARALGLNGEALNALERSMGLPATMELMARLGQRLGSSTGGSGGNDPLSSPEQARAEIARLKGDRAFHDKLKGPAHDSKANEARQRWEALHAAAYPAPDPTADTGGMVVSPPAGNAAPANGSREWALQEIERLRGDANFQNEMRTAGPGRQAAVDKWAGLHEAAYRQEGTTHAER